MRIVKNIAFIGLTLIFVGVILLRKDDIEVLINNYVSPKKVETEIGEKNQYYRQNKRRLVMSSTLLSSFFNSSCFSW